MTSCTQNDQGENQESSRKIILQKCTFYANKI
jgi:hypothetical protein